MRVLFLTDGIDIPASRFRAEQFFPHLEARGIRCTLRYAYDRNYNRVFTSRLAPAYKVAFRFKRSLQTMLATGFDVAFIQRTAFPQTALPERLLSTRIPIVLDFDDAIYLGADGRPNRLRAHGFEEAVRISTRILAGNAHLAHLTKAPERTAILPTVVDTDIFRPNPPRPGPEVTIGWMGTASNFPSLRTALPGIAQVLERDPKTRFRIVSNGTLTEAHALPRTEQIRWSREREVELLQSFDIGIMPLLDTPTSYGKCAFKMIQYMAVGRPVVASAIGANREVFEKSDAGALVATGGDWAEALKTLVDDPARRAACGANARKHAEAHYSINAVIDILEDTLRSAVD